MQSVYVDTYHVPMYLSIYLGIYPLLTCGGSRRWTIAWFNGIATARVVGCCQGCGMLNAVSLLIYSIPVTLQSKSPEGQPSALGLENQEGTHVNL